MRHVRLFQIHWFGLAKVVNKSGDRATQQWKLAGSHELEWVKHQIEFRGREINVLLYELYA